MKEQESIKIKVHQGKSGMHLVPNIDEWVISHSRKFPFLYVKQEEIIPHNIFFEDPEAFVLFAEKAGKKIGLFAGIPMNSEYMSATNYNLFTEMHRFTKQGFDPEKILYVAVFFIADEERKNHDVVLQLYQQAVHLAKKIGKTQMCYFTTIREEDHPLKPHPYLPPEPWEELPTPIRNMGIDLNFTWPTLQADGSVENQLNSQALYLLDI